MAAPLIAGAIAAPILGGLLGNEMARGDDRRAIEAQQKALEELRRLSLPEYERINDVALGGYEYTGDFTPQELSAVNLGPSAMEGIALDPAMREAQMRALSELQEISAGGGMNASDRARLAEMQTAVGRQERGSRDAIMQNMRERGIAGSGLELAANLSNQQAAAERASQESLNIEAMAQERAMQALMQSGQLAGSIRGQEFGEQSAKAQAKDAIAKFNAANMQDVRTQNWGAGNAASVRNLDARQQLGNANVDVGHKQTMANVDIAGMRNDNLARGFDDRFQKANAVAGGLGAIGSTFAQRGTSKRGMMSGVGQGVGQGLTAYAANKK
jgi:hypothetical protein